MPDVETYTFSHKEITEILIKASGVHEGKWMLQMNFGFSAGNFGPDDNSVSPGSIAVVNQIGITRAKPGSPGSLVADAAEVNPSPST